MFQLCTSPGPIGITGTKRIAQQPPYLKDTTGEELGSFGFFLGFYKASVRYIDLL